MNDTLFSAVGDRADSGSELSARTSLQILRRTLARCNTTVWRWDLPTQLFTILSGPKWDLPFDSGPLEQLLAAALPHGAAETEQIVAAALRDQQPFHISVPPAATNPEEDTILIHAAPQLDADGVCVGVCGITTILPAGHDDPDDIAVRSQPPTNLADLRVALDRAIGELDEAEELRERAENRLHAISEICGTVFLRTDAQGRLVEPSSAWLSYSGQSWPQAQGFGWLSTIQSEDRGRFQLLWDAASATADPFSLVVRLRRRYSRSGITRGLLRAAPVVSATGELTEWLIVFQQADDTADLSERTTEPFAGLSDRPGYASENSSPEQ